MKLETNAISIKPALKKQSEALAGLIKSYCGELLEIQSTISPKAIKRDGFGKHFQCVVAESSSGQIVGFAVWEHTYDIHWGVCGGNILDMYVMKELRGFGMAHRMMALICKNILDDGGVFLRGGAIDRGMAQKMSSRIAISVSGIECILGGKAFRVFAGLAGKSALEIARSLPSKDMNYQP